jgi:hypothetical protein
LIDYWEDDLDVVSGSDFWDDSTIFFMDVYLGFDDIGGSESG